MKQYHKIRWLSRWQMVITLYDFLDSVLYSFRDVKDKKHIGQTKFVFSNLNKFK